MSRKKSFRKKKKSYIQKRAKLKNYTTGSKKDQIKKNKIFNKNKTVQINDTKALITYSYTSFYLMAPNTVKFYSNVTLSVICPIKF